MRLILSKSVALAIIAIALVSTGCAKKTGGVSGVLGGRDGDRDSSGCTDDNTFSDIPGYEDDIPFHMVDNGAGSYSVRFTGGNNFRVTKNYDPSTLLAMTFIPQNGYVSLGYNLTGTSVQTANVRFFLYNSCSSESAPMFYVLSFGGGQNYYPMGNLTAGASLTVTVPDPYRYDVIAIEYVGIVGSVSGTQGQVGPESETSTSPFWSAACLHGGGLCDL